MALDLLLNVHLVDGEVVVDRVGVAGLAVEKAGLQIEGVGQAVRRIDAHDQRAVAEPGKLQPSGRGETGLAYAALAAEQKNAHKFTILDARRRAKVRGNHSRLSELL